MAYILLKHNDMMNRKGNILIVDDELGPRESLKMILKPHFNTHTAADGRTALEIIYKQPVDVVTLDLKMPGINGIDLLKAIKQYDPKIEIIIVTGYGNLKTALEAIRYGVIDYILKPFNVFEILSSINKGLERRMMSSYIKEKLESCQNEIDFDDLWVSMIGEVDSHTYWPPDLQQDNKEKYLDFLKVLAVTLESKDEYTHGHSGRVTYYSNLIADRIRMGDEERKYLQIAAFLHDIGKLGVSNSLVGKEGRLTPQERTLIQEHPEKGVSLIEPLNVPREILDIIRHHHEQYNGEGYPYGLKGEGIPIGARIVTIADAYDAMSSQRPYRNPLSKAQIKKELIRCSGTQFCPYLTQVFLEIMDSEELSSYCDHLQVPETAVKISGGV